MKIRAGFVSNSSSTSYVIALTRDFKVTQDHIQRFTDEIKSYKDEDYTIEQATNQIGLTIEALCSVAGREMWEEHSPVQYLGEFINIFRSDFIILAMFDCSSEDGKIINILAGGLGDERVAKLKAIMENLNEDS